jgi:hypothetical protein
VPQPANPQPAADDSGKWKYGVTVVLAGLVVILLAFVLSLSEYEKAADVSTALAPVTGVVGTLVGAYFGVQVGAAGKEKAEEKRERSEAEAKAALAALPPEEAKAVRAAFR